MYVLESFGVPCVAGRGLMPLQVAWEVSNQGGPRSQTTFQSHFHEFGSAPVCTVSFSLFELYGDDQHGRCGLQACTLDLHSSPAWYADMDSDACHARPYKLMTNDDAYQHRIPSNPSVSL